MTHLLWKHYWDDDVDKFRRLLAPAAYAVPAPSAARSPLIGPVGSQSPNNIGSLPRAGKLRKSSGFGASFGGKSNGGNLGKGDVNSRDHAGLTVLLRAASSTSENALPFVETLLEHPAIDIYVQDPESGWNALHRALYAGNVSIARLLLEKERKDLMGHARGAAINKVGQLIKTKDHEGNSPFDLYNSTIAERLLKAKEDEIGEIDSDTDMAPAAGDESSSAKYQAILGGDEVFAFGSNRNMSLGFGDQDDRQFPERVYLDRPEYLIRKFYEDYLEDTGSNAPGSFDVAKIPTLVRNKPLVIHDVVLSKLHSAILTTDPLANLYMCGIGRGGRLGLGDENTRFTYTPVSGALAEKKVVQVALGQNHSLAITFEGELWTWGSNAYSQLGYTLPTPAKADEDPLSVIPRQVFGPIKKETVIGIAASAIHSVAHTGTSLYCWGKNEGQLALMDADSRSLEVQQVPRKVAASMFSSPIVMVSAIEKATTVLLQNHTVCVFTGYGYHIVKFPFAEALTDRRLGNLSMSIRYEAGRNQIQSITSGGETIAAVTGRGDLFTMTLNHKIDSNSGASSTTNPSKLKGAITQPQCIWNARKDGVRSVGVGEHGSVIISTQSGAVWLRIKRTNAKDAYAAGSGSKRKDFKFQRVPYISKVATVRASAYGAFAAIRKDSTVMDEQIYIDDQMLWEDIAPLNCLSKFSASPHGKKDKDTLSYWNADTLRQNLGPTVYEILKSPDLEADLKKHLDAWTSANDLLDVAMCTTTSPDLVIPVHGWLLAARSPVLRLALSQCRQAGQPEIPDTLTIEAVDKKVLLTFHGLDILSLLNIVFYVYEDTVVPAWNFARQAATLAYRYRQVRVEVMKVATRLQMTNLETAARIQTPPVKCLDRDLRMAMQDRTFFEDGDTLLKLNGLDVTVHSTFVVQRCPWFGGLFNGRSKGLWLASRRAEQNPSDKTEIDLSHMEPQAFQYVLKYLYGDFGGELFDPTISASLDDFIEEVMQVMAIADELMIDRLSQICQHVMGKFADTRSIAHFLNAISPFAITEFKDAGLEYICLQLESMLENHFLDDLDQDLLLELDEVVRENQAAQMHWARKGLTEERLLEKYPDLAQDIDEERQRRVREFAFKASQRDDERKLSTSFKGRYGSIDDGLSLTPDKTRQSSKRGKNEPFSPSLRPKESQADLMFDMDEEDGPALSSPLARPQKSSQTAIALDLEQIPPLGESLNAANSRSAAERTGLSLGSPMGSLPARPAVRTGASISSHVGGSPWQQKTLPTAKLDLRDIIQSESSQSALSAGLEAQRVKEAERKPSQPKMSQKERKKQQQEQAAQALLLNSTPPSKAWDTSADAQASPWKTVSQKKSALKDVLAGTPSPSIPAISKPPVAGEMASSSIRRTASPDTRFSGQTRKTSSPSVQGAKMQGKTPLSLPSTSAPIPLTPPRPLVPHSKVYVTPAPKLQHELGASMADIIGQQRREQEMVKEAVAKRSLQEIQEEQAFQEWWEAESLRTQEEEANRLAKEKEREQGSAKKGARRGRGGKTRSGSNAGPTGRSGEASDAGNKPDRSDAQPSGGSPARGKPRGRGRGQSRGNASTAATRT